QRRKPVAQWSLDRVPERPPLPSRHTFHGRSLPLQEFGYLHPSPPRIGAAPPDDEHVFRRTSFVVRLSDPRRSPKPVATRRTDLIREEYRRPWPTQSKSSPAAVFLPASASCSHLVSSLSRPAPAAPPA